MPGDAVMDRIKPDADMVHVGRVAWIMRLVGIY
jgi:hypothetical protein